MGDENKPSSSSSKKSDAGKSKVVKVARDEGYLNAVLDKRIKMFELIQAEQFAHRQSIGGEPIKITLPDGAVKEGKKWLTSPLHIAKEISSGLAATVLIAQVNQTLWDISRPLEGDCELKLFKFDSNEGRDTFWHSSAHILGQALETKYGCKLCIGPCTTRGEGFYYDAYYEDLTLNEEHFGQIQSQANKATAEKQSFERIEVSRAHALEMFAENRFKIEIINELPEDKTITVYRCGPLVDLCRGPHIPNTSFVKAFACLKASSSYWRGKSDRESLQRVYGISFPDAKRLKEYLTMLEEAKKYDHRILGQNQELFFFHPLSPGSCFFLPYGTRIYNKLVDFIRAQYRNRGYQEVLTPNIYQMQLWETSGHAANYKENMFVFKIGKQEFGLKPMNCPGHCLMFEHIVRSNRELPLRLADFGVLHRNELSGALTGLTRVRRFQQDDAHIFCRESQIKDEVKGVLDFINCIYNIFGFTFELELSTRPPEKYLGDIETWDKAEAALKEALDEFGKPWQINEGDGAFYGPKIDVGVFDALKRKFQCATLQSYSIGSVERMLAILLEHYKGKWPFWLSPRQAMVCPVSDKSLPYALQVYDQVHEAGYHVDIDMTDRTINKKVREAQLAQYNFILVVGEKEVDTGEVSVRVRDKNDHTAKTVKELLAYFKEEADACLKEHRTMLEEAEKHDQRIFGQNQELLFFHPLSPGSCFFLPYGTRIYNKLVDFIRAQYRNRGYQEVLTPNIYSMQLWETSGHAANYKENMFVIEIEKQEFGLKLMNCPGHCLMFQHRVRSYRELPLRLADFGVLHRKELSGTLTGLTRVRRFQQDDAHIFCRESQVKDEVKGVLDFINHVYNIFGFTFELELSTRPPEKYMGDMETWDKAVAVLKEALDEFGKPWQINKGDGAFYGPKIDVGVFDALKRKFQCATLQLDFQLPLLFKLSYSAEDEAKIERPVMIHRTILGSVERMFTILLEHYKGKWPFWLSPRQVMVCPVSDKSLSYALQVHNQVHEAGYHVDIDKTDRTINEKVQEAQLAQYNFILVVGEKEVDSGEVSVHVRDKNDHSMKTVDDLLAYFKEEAEAYH